MEPDLIACLEEAMELPEKDFSQYSPLTLAWLGDSVYDVIVRTLLTRKANKQAYKLHREASSMVCAKAQAAMITALQPFLSEQEAAIYRRGHNASPSHNAKNATRREYLEATGFEALVGFLYLQKDYRRMMELIKKGWELTGMGED